MRRRHRLSTLTLPLLLLLGTGTWAPLANVLGETPANLQIVLDQSKPLEAPVRGRLPLFILPISNSLAPCDDTEALKLLGELDRRGLGYTVDWHPSQTEKSLQEGLRIGAMQEQLGMTVGVNANACLYSFFDGSEDTLHVDAAGETFAETSFGGELGCPFALQHRHAAMKDRLTPFLKAYQEAGIEVDFIFADWEIDGPIEWNDAWQTSQRCQRCREHLPNLAHDFRSFQQRLRSIRSEMQRVVFGDHVTAAFPEALVGNYGTYPHDGMRYWYDYFEKVPSAEGIPIVWDQKAPYREWAHEFQGTGYTFAMPVVYTWYPIHDWYAFEDRDFRWFYNLLKVGSNAGQHTPASTPLIPFVHWHTTAPPKEPDPNVRQFSETKYRDLLWHLLLRGHDTFFLWCMGNELADETRLVHRVYADSQPYSGFIERGQPIHFAVPEKEEAVISGLRLGNRVLVKRTNFGNDTAPKTLTLSDGQRLRVSNREDLHVISMESPPQATGFLKDSKGRVRFPIGMYEHPGSIDELKRMAQAGINLVRCGNRDQLERAHGQGMMGWVSLGIQDGATDGLREAIESVKDHPALTVWEGPDEIVWTFTAYSFLEERAGFTRQDWENQKPIAVEYARKEGERITRGMREGIGLVRELDQRKLPFWVNEAADSDAKYVRDYVDHIDITGCDYYAVRAAGTDLPSIGRLVHRWDAIGFGRPVWMVLQGFSLHTIKPERARLYPSFRDSRFMAYDAIVHGSRGILYWGTNTIDDPHFRTSLYALTAELAALESYLVTPTVSTPTVRLIDDLFDPRERLGVHARLFHRGQDALLLLVNEDAHRHLGVEVRDLSGLNGRQLYRLYRDDNHINAPSEDVPITVSKERILTRLQAHDVQLYTTDRSVRSTWQEGRQYFDSDAPGAKP